MMGSRRSAIEYLLFVDALLLHVGDEVAEVIHASEFEFLELLRCQISDIKRLQRGRIFKFQLPYDVPDGEGGLREE